MVHEITSPRAKHVVSSTAVAEQVSAIMAVLVERTPRERGLDHFGDSELPAAGTDDGPEIVVVVEPARRGITAELLGVAAVLAAEIDGHVVAFGPSHSKLQGDQELVSGLCTGVRRLRCGVRV